MGADHTYRYVNTNGVPNSNSGTYTFAVNDTGGTKDMGTTNTYRYVNATNVYNKGKADGGGCTLLWTNSNTTVAFAAQTLSIDLTNYDGVIIAGLGCTSINVSGANGSYIYPYVYLKKDQISSQFIYFGTSTYGGYYALGIRLVRSITNSGIEFDVGYGLNPNWRQDNGWGLPYKIWGIKCSNLPTFS